jgi:hypothetical protein
VIQTWGAAISGLINIPPSDGINRFITTIMDQVLDCSLYAAEEGFRSPESDLFHIYFFRSANERALSRPDSSTELCRSRDIGVSRLFQTRFDHSSSSCWESFAARNPASAVFTFTILSLPHPIRLSSPFFVVACTFFIGLVSKAKHPIRYRLRRFWVTINDWNLFIYAPP